MMKSKILSALVSILLGFILLFGLSALWTCIWDDVPIYAIIIGAVLSFLVAKYTYLGIRNVIFHQELDKSRNPINSITSEGCMGFLLGDEEAFVLSRIAHLGLMNDKEVQDYIFCKQHELEMEQFSTQRGQIDVERISTCRGRFEHIRGITFSIKDEHLAAITIFLTNSPSSRALKKEELKARLQLKLGLPTECNDETVFWGPKKGNIALYTTVDKESVIIIAIDIL